MIYDYLYGSSWYYRAVSYETSEMYLGGVVLWAPMILDSQYKVFKQAPS